MVLVLILILILPTTSRLGDLKLDWIGSGWGLDFETGIDDFLFITVIIVITTRMGGY